MMDEKRLSFLQKKYEAKLKPRSDEEMIADMAKAAGDGQKGGPGRGRGPGPGRGMPTGKPKNSKATVKRLLGYLAGNEIKLFVVFMCVIGSTLLSLAATYMLRPIINNLTNEDATVGKLLSGILVMAVIYACGAFTQYLQSRIMINISQNAIKKLRGDLFDKLEELPIRYYDSNSNGDIMSRFTNDVDAVGEMLNSTVVQLISGVIQFTGTLALMIYTNWLLTLITLATVPVIMFAIKTITTYSRKYYRLQQAAIGTVNGYIEETMQGQRVVKVFNHEEAAKEEFDYLNQDLKNKQINALFFGGIMFPVMGNLSQISYAITAAVGGVLCVARGFDVGGLTVFVNYSRHFSMPLNQLAMQVNTIFSALAGAERVFAVMDAEPEEEDVPDAVEIIEEDEKLLYKISKEASFLEETGVPGEILREDDTYYYIEVKGAVTLTDVTFGYVPDKIVIEDISLYAKPGQKIAFVGSTGAGKTTITNLINRFYDINEGSITIDGIPVRAFERDSLRRNIAMVLQDTHLFTGTVMENIRYGRLTATDEDVIEAAKVASAHSFIMRLENGYDTMLEGDGANLSQGQRQLINIARAAISKAPILILDEATSSVDTRTEKHIEHGMDRIMATRTTLVIAHRLSTVRNANAIMVLEHGRIIERGDHDDLLENKGRYYELYTGKSKLD
ncbi:MAG: ABC transporter ATP-binding protein/permease [Lachnospiraceae bacterium]|nr:ABC transporter ATP-binding protein/permease [Lachnospiraceae bacterium]